MMLNKVNFHRPSNPPVSAVCTLTPLLPMVIMDTSAGCPVSHLLLIIRVFWNARHEFLQHLQIITFVMLSSPHMSSH